MLRKHKVPRPSIGRPKENKDRNLQRKMFLIDDATNEIMRNVCYENRISFSELIRQMIDTMIENKWKYFNANYRGE